MKFMQDSESGPRDILSWDADLVGHFAESPVSVACPSSTKHRRCQP